MLSWLCCKKKAANINPELMKIQVDNELLNQLEKITGIFDTHLTVDETEIYKLNNFCNYRNIPLAYAIGKQGTYKQHLMTTSYLENTNGKKAVLDSFKLAKEMKEYGIKVLRIKVESLARNNGVTEFVNSKFFKDCNHYYFEFHFKVKNRSEIDQQNIDNVCRKYNGSYAINFLSKNRYDPLIAFRVRGNYDKALEKREELVAAFSRNNVETLIDGTHYEICIFDNNYKLDENFVPDAIDV